jgi:hypothetical protein
LAILTRKSEAVEILSVVPESVVVWEWEVRSSAHPAALLFIALCVAAFAPVIGADSAWWSSGGLWPGAGGGWPIPPSCFLLAKTLFLKHSLRI